MNDMEDEIHGRFESSIKKTGLETLTERVVVKHEQANDRKLKEHQKIQELYLYNQPYVMHAREHADRLEDHKLIAGTYLSIKLLQHVSRFTLVLLMLTDMTVNFFPMVHGLHVLEKGKRNNKA